MFWYIYCSMSDDCFAWNLKSQTNKLPTSLLYLYLHTLITCHVIVFMPLTNPRSPRAVHKFPYCPLTGLKLHDIPRHLTFELDHERKWTCTMIFFIIFFIFRVHVHVWASLAVTCNKCVIDCGFGKYRTQYTPSRLCRLSVYRTVLPSPQSITHKYKHIYIK